MSMETVYNPHQHEHEINSLWQKIRLGNPETQAKVQGLENKPVHIILDCDGVLADSWDMIIKARVWGGLAENTKQSILYQHERHKKSPFEKSVGKIKKELEKNYNWHEIIYRYNQEYHEYKPFSGFIEELKKLPGSSNLAIVTSNGKKLVTEFAKKSGLKFSHILGFEDAPDKESKVLKILKEWNLKPVEVLFITDTLSDILEIKNVLPLENILGADWGWHGITNLKNLNNFDPKFMGLREVLPERQILKKFSDITKFLLKFKIKNTSHCILMPPPNLTGTLHAGHSFQHYLMDTLSRIKRQEGKINLWYPGVDHAGIQLEGIIDKLIKSGEQETKILEASKKLGLKIDQSQLTNPKFLKSSFPQIWKSIAWEKVTEWRDYQKKQASLLGDTPDYSRELFTLDNRAEKMVFEAFRSYYQDDLIYRGPYLVNWSVGLQTALSDVAGEIEYEKRIDPLVTFQYQALKIEIDTPLDFSVTKFGSEEFFWEFLKSEIKPLSSWPRLNLATVRPETKFTDLAVAMHPSKYHEYIGLKIFLKETVNQNSETVLREEFTKLILDQKISIFYDLPPLKSKPVKLIFSEKVDPSFGSGIVKITPGHDIFDFKLYQEFVEKGLLPANAVQTCIDRDGKLKAEFCGEFSSMTAYESRPYIIKKLIETGYVPKKSDYILDHMESDSRVVEVLNDELFDKLSTQEQLKYLEQLHPEYEIQWDYEHNVAICERSKTVIEPLISEEFFLSYHQEFIKADTSTNLKKLGQEGLDEIEFFTPDFKDRGLNFLENINDWCISRNLIWGHQIPVWYNTDVNSEKKFFKKSEIKSWPQSLIQSKYLVFDFDGVLYNGINSDLQVTFDLDKEKGLTQEQSLKKFYDYFYKPQHANKNNLSQEEKHKWLKHHVKFGKLRSNYSHLDSFFLDFCEIIKSLKNLKFAVISSSSETYIIPLIKKLGINFDYILGCETSLSKEEKIKILAKKWGVEIENLIYFTDANNDVIELSDALPLSNIIGCAWGYVGRDKLSEVLPLNQILETQKEFGEIPMVISDTKPSIPGNWVREEKILDTWFSSCLWPLSTLNFLDHKNGLESDFDLFYPTDEMITAKEIFYVWIVRMVVLGKYFTGQIPFKKVVITPTILDQEGKKMSKSLGNGLDPIEAITRFSSDSLRLSMLSGMIPNRNFRLGGSSADKLMEKYRNFGTKIWNIARFLQLQKNSGISISTSANAPTVATIWIYSKFKETRDAVKKYCHTYQLAHSVDFLYDFVWNYFANWYVEYLKTDSSQIFYAIKIFESYIQLLYPFSPFISEVLWKKFCNSHQELAFSLENQELEILFRKYQSCDISEFELIQKIVTEIRSLKGLFSIDPVKSIEIFSQSPLLFKYATYLKTLTNAEILRSQHQQKSLKLEIEGVAFSIDFLNYLQDLQLEISKTYKQQNSLKKQIDLLNSQLQNQKFLEKADPEIIAKKRQDLKDRESQLKSLNQKLDYLQNNTRD